MTESGNAGLALYGKSVPPGAVCEGCGTAGRLGRDHCHEHGWVRAILCTGCNVSVARIDKHIRPARADLGLLIRLLALRNRCPDCAPLGIADLSPFRSKAKTNAENQRAYRERQAQRLADLKAQNAALGAEIARRREALAVKLAEIERLKGLRRKPAATP